MKKRTTLQLNIPEPCHENWDQMTPNEQGRFCQNCQKTVVDFTAMSNVELFNFFKNHKGGLCGRLPANILNQPIHGGQQSKNVGLSRWAKAGLVAAGLLTAIPNQAQQNLIPKTEFQTTQSTLSKEKVTDKSKKPVSNIVTIKGVVYDQSTNEPLIGANIWVQGTKLGATTNFDGVYSLSIDTTKVKDSITLEISYIGFTAKHISYKKSQISSLNKKPFLVNAHLELLDVNLPPIHVISQQAIIKGKIVMGGVSIITSKKKDYKEETVWLKLTTWLKKRKRKRLERNALKTKRIKKNLQNQQFSHTNNKQQNDLEFSIGQVSTQPSYQVKPFPNPFTANLNIEYNSTSTQQLTFILVDTQGKQLLSGSLNLLKGKQQVQLNTPTNLADGIYFIHFQNKKNEKLSVRVVKVSR